MRRRDYSGFRTAPIAATADSSSDTAAFQPANDKPQPSGNRQLASVHETMRMPFNWLRRSSLVVACPAPAAPQSDGPGHQPYSAPA